MMKVRFFLLVCFLSSSLFADQPYYVGNFGDHNFWSVDPVTGIPTLISTIAPGTPGGPLQFALKSPDVGYLLNYSFVSDATVYQLNPLTGAYSQFAIPPEPAEGLAIVSNSMAYVGAGNHIYSLNLTNGSFQNLTPVPISNTLFISSMAIRNNTAYVVGFIDLNLYAVNLQTGTSIQVTPANINPNGSSGIALGRNTAYVTDPYTNEIWSVDLQTGSPSLLTTLPGPFDFMSIQLLDNNTALVTKQNNLMYRVNLTTGAYSALTPSPIPGTTGNNNGIAALGIFPQVQTSGLSGNNLSLANYLNTNAPLTTELLYLFTQSELQEALEAVAPTRNAFATFASQNGFIASAQVVTDHLHQSRFVSKKGSNFQRPVAENSFLVDASEEISSSCCCRAYPYTGWVAGFGEYAHEKAQDQTPGFSASLGGVVAGVDRSFINDNLVGFAGAYVHTHVHQENGMGYANVDQGFLTLYGLLHAAEWNFDMGLWGGYYSIANHRKIFIAPSNFYNYANVNSTAKSHTYGAQLAPHFEVSNDHYLSLNCDPRFGLVPFLTADWVANWEHSFQEHGAEGYNMFQMGRFCSLLRGEVGLRFHEIVNYNWGDLVFEEKAAYAFQSLFGTGRVNAFLVGSGGSFTVSTLTDTQHLGVVELAMHFAPCRPMTPYVDLRYQGEFGSLYQSHQGIFEIGLHF